MDLSRRGRGATSGASSSRAGQHRDGSSFGRETTRREGRPSGERTTTLDMPAAVQAPRADVYNEERRQQAAPGAPRAPHDPRLVPARSAAAEYFPRPEESLRRTLRANPDGEQLHSDSGAAGSSQTVLPVRADYEERQAAPDAPRAPPRLPLLPATSPSAAAEHRAGGPLEDLRRTIRANPDDEQVHSDSDWAQSAAGSML